MRIWPEKTQDKEFIDLGSLGFTGALNDRQYAFLRNFGYTGSLADMMTSFYSYTPAVLFSAGQIGAWFDPSDTTTVFQDTAGTQPVTASGQPVALMLDKSGRGNHATQATPASRPIYREAGGKAYLEFDGIDDWLQTASINFSATNKMTVWAGVRKLSDAAQGVVVELTNAATNRFTISAPTGATANFGFANGGSTIVFPSTAPSYPSPFSSVLTGIGDISGDVATLRVNGAQAAQVLTDQGTGNYANAALYIGRRGGTTLPFKGYLYGLIVRGAASSADQITKTEKWLNSRAGAY